MGQVSGHNQWKGIDLAIDGESLDLAVIVAVARYAPQTSPYTLISILTGQTMQ